MDANLRATLIASIHRRATALAKVTADPDLASSPVLAMFFTNLLTPACALLGDTLLYGVLETIFGEVSEKHGVCRYCREGAFIVEKGMCEACWKGLETEDEELKREEMMAGRVKGRKM